MAQNRPLAAVCGSQPVSIKFLDIIYVKKERHFPIEVKTI